MKNAKTIMCFPCLVHDGKRFTQRKQHRWSEYCLSEHFVLNWEAKMECPIVIYAMPFVQCDINFQSGSINE